MSVLLHPAILSSENFISSTSIYSIQLCTTFDQMFFLKLVVIRNTVESIMVRNMLLDLILQSSLNETTHWTNMYTAWTLDHVVVAIEQHGGFVIFW